MKKITRLLSLLIICNLSAFSQKLTFNQYEFIRAANAKSTLRTTFDNQYKDIKGEAFLTNDWVKGKAILATGQEFENSFKLDLYSNKAFMNVHDTVFDVTDAITKKLLLYPNKSNITDTLVFTKEYKVPKAKGSFLQVLAAGKIIFLKSYVRNIQEVQEGAYANKEKQFADNIRYYILKDGVPAEIKLTKKAVEKSFPAEEWQKMQEFIKENNIAFSEEKDIAYLMNYYNQKFTL